MFTGIIENSAKLLKRTDTSITIKRPENFTKLTIGQSIANNGACLSVTKYDDTSISFDVVPESFARTNLASAELINLERAMTANGRFEGHIVLGHVDGVVELLKKKPEGEGERLTFSAPDTLKPFLTEKGSITLNGVSLTIASVSEKNFDVAIIPQTLEKTNFHALKTGDMVNYEADYFAKLLHKWQETSYSG